MRVLIIKRRENDMMKEWKSRVNRRLSGGEKYEL